jgi:hypothetical protein
MDRSLDFHDHSVGQDFDLLWSRLGALVVKTDTSTGREIPFGVAFALSRTLLLIFQPGLRRLVAPRDRP